MALLWCDTYCMYSSWLGKEPKRLVPVESKVNAYRVSRVFPSESVFHTIVAEVSQPSLSKFV